MATSIEGNQIPAINSQPGKRGVTVYNAFELLSASGYKKDGDRLTVSYEMPIFMLTVSERIDIARLCSPVFAVVINRANRIAGLGWKVTKESKEEDRIVEKLKRMKELHDEYENELGPKALGIRVRAKSEIYKTLRDVKGDLSNFDASLRRWSRAIREVREDKCSEIEDWLKHPNADDTFEDYIKKLSMDMLIHGAAAPYKQVLGGRVENLYALPGGSVYAVRGRYVGDATGFIQMTDNSEPQIFFSDEVNMLRYAPRSDLSYGMIPLESLVNKVAESLMFDQRAAEQADGTKPPEKVVVFGEKDSPFGGIGNEFSLPMNKGEQKRIETTLNEARKEAVRTLSGIGTPVVLDLSRENVFAAQSERQRMVREEVGLVFGASNLEMNLTGAGDTSGRSTSESQERYDQYKGIYPMIQTIENYINQEVFPFRYGHGYRFEYGTGKGQEAELAMLRAKIDSGLYTVNEIRTQDIGIDPLKGEEYDKPKGQVAPAAPAAML